MAMAYSALARCCLRRRPSAYTPGVETCFQELSLHLVDPRGRETYAGVVHFSWCLSACGNLAPAVGAFA